MNTMAMHGQDFEHTGGIQSLYAQKSARMLKNMKEDPLGICAETILHEASAVLQAALRHASELSEVGVTADDLHLMRVLITHVAVHSYTSLEKNTNVTAEVRELQIIKEVILRTAEMRFGHTNNVLNEFKYAARHKSFA
jgi:hypothetical protein